MFLVNRPQDTTFKERRLKESWAKLMAKLTSEDKARRKRDAKQAALAAFGKRAKPLPFGVKTPFGHDGRYS